MMTKFFTPIVGIVQIAELGRHITEIINNKTTGNDRFDKGKSVEVFLAFGIVYYPTSLCV